MYIAYKKIRLRKRKVKIMTKRLGFTLAEGATHADMFKGSRKNAFTLAEVLITLGIIGVVAAMTMPTLMNSTNGAQYKTAYKKALSVLSQAVVLNVALDDYDLSQTTSTVAGEDESGNEPASLFNLFDHRMNVVKTEGNVYKALLKSTTSNKTMKTETEDVFGVDGNYTLYFNDGITFTFPKAAMGCSEGDKSGKAAVDCRGVIDVNGEKNPNKEVVCDSDSPAGECVVTNPTDIYPVVMYDQTILPATDAGDAVLYGGK